MRNAINRAYSVHTHQSINKNLFCCRSLLELLLVEALTLQSVSGELILKIDGAISFYDICLSNFAIFFSWLHLFKYIQDQIQTEIYS